MTPHTRGFLLTLLGVLLLTPEALIVRLVDSDPWTLALWRGVPCGGVILLGYLAVARGRAVHELRALGRAGAAVAVLFAMNAICFVVALHNTTVANTLVILATTPLIAALMSYAFLREAVALPTWAAIAAGFVGILIVVADGLGRGSTLGDANALITAATLAATFVLIRRRRDVNMVPAAGAGNLLAALLALPLAQPASLAGHQIELVLLLGLFFAPAAFALLAMGPRTLPAPEVALLLLLETVLGPLWVWIGVAEVPSPAAFLGGGIVVCTLVAHSIWRLRRPATSPPQQGP